MSSPVVAGTLYPSSSSVWRRRFLTYYDYPIIDNIGDFAVAYKLRRFLLRKFVSCSGDQEEKYQAQLQVVKDMVLETFNHSKARLQCSNPSKNLTAFQSPNCNPWMNTFLSCALYGHNIDKYGKSNKLFDALQVVLSHLVLSAESPFASMISTNRDNYDLVRVYSWNIPLKPIVHRLLSAEDVTVSIKRISPNLKTPSLEPCMPRYEIDMHTLLHIRNFWHRHMVDEASKMHENTYIVMMQALRRVRESPQAWDQSLYERVNLSKSWYGHYSCLHPWPKTRNDLEERQSCAEDWQQVDPRTLRVETSTANENDQFWPPAFASLPIFKDMIPSTATAGRLNLEFIRGIAPFVSVQEMTDADVNAEQTASKWHDFTACRVHGFVHDLPLAKLETTRKSNVKRRRHGTPPCETTDGSDIPGWKRIVMVMYMPDVQHLISVLEHAHEGYGVPINTHQSHELGTSNVWQPIGEIVDQEISDNDSNASTVELGTDEDNQTSEDTVEERIRNSFLRVLNRRIQSFTKRYNMRYTDQAFNLDTLAGQHAAGQNLPPLFSPRHIRQIEESFSEIKYLTWDDGTIEYAYAYEGVIIPGGKIMLGKWWRIDGEHGMGPGKEIGPDGTGIEVREIENSSTGENCLETEEDSVDDRKKRPNHKCKKRKRFSRAEDGDAEERKTPEFEFVTMVDGEETRSTGGSHQLERGPFIFWAARSEMC